jgi:hypothetical protein
MFEQEMRDVERFSSVNDCVKLALCEDLARCLQH